MKVIVPMLVTDDMLSSSTIAEPDSGEAEWATSTAYVVGQKVIRTQTHRIYRCVQAHTSGSITPEELPEYWQDYKPTNKWAMFDGVISTASEDTETLTVVLEPGWFNALAFFGLNGETITVTVKDEPAGATVYSYTGPLIEDVGDWYEYFFGAIKPKRKLILTDIPPYAACEVTVTVEGPAATTVSLGLMALGDLRVLAEELGTQYGSSSEPVDYSYVKTFEDGTTKIVKRNSATDMRAQVALTIEEAPYAVATCQDLLSVPAVWIGSEATGYEGLTVYGLGSASFTYQSTHVQMSLYVKGLI